jgi:hypothetical protein
MEMRDLTYLQWHQAPSSPTEVKLEGVLSHSALGVFKVKTLYGKESVQVIAYAALVSIVNNGGRHFGCLLTIPDHVNTITFGEQKTVIWNRNSDNEAGKFKRLDGGYAPEISSVSVIIDSNELTDSDLPDNIENLFEIYESIKRVLQQTGDARLIRLSGSWSFNHER